MGAGEPLDRCSELLDTGRMGVEVLVVGTVAEQLAHEETEDRVIGSGPGLEVTRRQAGGLGPAGIDDPQLAAGGEFPQPDDRVRHEQRLTVGDHGVRTHDDEHAVLVEVGLGEQAGHAAHELGHDHGGDDIDRGVAVVARGRDGAHQQVRGEQPAASKYPPEPTKYPTADGPCSSRMRRTRVATSSRDSSHVASTRLSPRRITGRFSRAGMVMQRRDGTALRARVPLGQDVLMVAPHPDDGVAFGRHHDPAPGDTDPAVGRPFGRHHTFRPGARSGRAPPRVPCRRRRAARHRRRAARSPRSVLITHGTPSSRATIAPWLNGPPTSMTSADATQEVADPARVRRVADEDLSRFDRVIGRRVDDDAAPALRPRRGTPRCP